MKLPSNYLVVDIETSALQPNDGFIWNIGMRATLDRAPQSEKGEDFYLLQPPAMLKTATFEINRRKANAQSIPLDKSSSHIPVRDDQYYKAEQSFVDEVTSKGKDPKVVLQHVADTINMFVDNKWYLAGQNICKFDLFWLDYHFKYYGIKCDLPVDRIIDVGVLIKAAQLRRSQAVNESCKAFYHRVASERAKGVFFALERFCVPYFGMIEKYGLDMSQAHGAGFDCYLTDLVFKELVNEVLASEGVMT